MLKSINDWIDFTNIERCLKEFKGNIPFDHCVIDGFFKADVASILESEFPLFEDKEWYEYENAIENKKALNNWNLFPTNTYKVFSLLNTSEFITMLSRSIGVDLYPDNGLHGGGWHIHATGGNLNPHYDYSIHPKLGLQRKINIIIYLSSSLREGMGGDLGLWNHDFETNSPGKLEKEVVPIFNRAVIFDTTQNSWHGMSKVLQCPENVYRKSLAIYYLCTPENDSPKHQRALFAPRESQKGDKNVEELIRKRSDLRLSKDVYKS